MAKQKIKPRGLKKLNLGGGENAREYHESMIDDGYHALEGDEYRTNEAAANNLKGTGMNPPSPNDIENELRKRVPEKESPIRMYKTPTKFVSPGMTPEATGSGFKMSMGSKENFSDSNFSSKDQSTMSQAPSIMKDDWGGETIEMKDQGSPLNYGKRKQVAKKRKMTDAENLSIGQKTNQERNRQGLKDALAIGQTVGNIVGAVT
jgi:hypothetical protein